jgi:hypothetical protein
MSALKQGLGTVDPYLGAADMTGFIRSQEGDEVTNLLRRPGLPADERNVALGILDRDLTSSFSALVLSPISVLIAPGQITFTLILSGPSSTASILARATWPALLLE